MISTQPKRDHSSFAATYFRVSKCAKVEFLRFVLSHVGFFCGCAHAGASWVALFEAFRTALCAASTSRPRRNGLPCLLSRRCVVRINDWLSGSVVRWFEQVQSRRRYRRNVAPGRKQVSCRASTDFL
jgi:hypothetical protein